MQAREQSFGGNELPHRGAFGVTTNENLSTVVQLDRGANHHWDSTIACNALVSIKPRVEPGGQLPDRSPFFFARDTSPIRTSPFAHPQRHLRVSPYVVIPARMASRAAVGRHQDHVLFQSEVNERSLPWLARLSAPVTQYDDVFGAGKIEPPAAQPHQRGIDVAARVNQTPRDEPQLRELLHKLIVRRLRSGGIDFRNAALLHICGRLCPPGRRDATGFSSPRRRRYSALALNVKSAVAAEPSATVTDAVCVPIFSCQASIL